MRGDRESTLGTLAWAKSAVRQRGRKMRRKWSQTVGGEGGEETEGEGEKDRGRRVRVGRNREGRGSREQK